MTNKIIYALMVRQLAQISQQKTAANRATLAKLRRGVGKPAGTIPEIWEFTLGALPEELASQSGTASYSEVAVHTALTLYALHSQGNAGMHDDKAGSIGQAAARLKQVKPNNVDGIKRRFDALATAKSVGEISYHARSLIQLLKQEKIPLNYAQFASDLFSLQFESGRERVLLQWGRDFSRSHKVEKEQNA